MSIQKTVFSTLAMIALSVALNPVCAAGRADASNRIRQTDAVDATGPAGHETAGVPGLGNQLSFGILVSPERRISRSALAMASSIAGNACSPLWSKVTRLPDTMASNPEVEPKILRICPNVSRGGPGFTTLASPVLSSPR